MYLRTHLRLAERQGLLAQRHISAVQTYGLTILGHLDTIAEAKEDVRLLKHSLIANGWNYKKLFPEYDDEPEEVIDYDGNDADIPTDAVWDTSQVVWKSPSDDPGAFEKLMAQINSRPGTFSGNDVVATTEANLDEPMTWTNWE